MKVIKYRALGKTIVAVPKEDGTYENVEQDLFYDMERPYSEQAEELAKKEAYDGKYKIVYEGQPPVLAPHNLTEGEYITISGVMYKAISNIPNGEPIITGQNAIETTIEEQLAEVAKGE